MFWDKIVDWFSDVRERNSVVRDFNKAARNAYIVGVASTLLDAKITIGCLEYRHAFSKWMAGGFRIKVLSGKVLTRDELMTIGDIVLKNDELVRKLVALGWDTLEIHDDMNGTIGLKWELKKYTNIGGHLS
jgi:hypothetical protein